ncbi:AAA family ATPase [Dokdonia sp. Asnod2-E02]|uniref:AAA family ATPase n=1 Tax=Dokdonia sp. Asnod2-E02 TaxID=3160574 RepID=UPI0038701218
MHFHQKIHDYLLNYRTNFDSSFNFIVRQRASTKDKNYLGGKFAQGLVFQGTNDYCFVGLVDKSGGANATKSVGLVFKPIQDGFTVNLDIVFPGETDQWLVDFYKSLASKFDDIRWDPKGTRAYKIIGDFQEGQPQLIYDWLKQNYPIIKQVAIDSEIPDLIISDQKFQELQENSQRKLKEARKSVENKITTSEKKYWLLSPGRNAIMWDKFYEEGYMALGWDELGDLTQYSNKDSIRDALREYYGGEGNKMNDVTANWEFANDMSLGDVVIIKKGKSTLLGYGIITSEYYHESNYKYHNRRKVNWVKKGIWNIDHSMVLKTLTDVSSYKSKVENYEYYYEWLMSKMDSVKEKFLDWFYSRPELKYKDISSERISQDLEDSNTYFDIDIFNVDQNNYLEVIEILNEVSTNKDGLFYKFSKDTGTHRPRALLGKENYQKFLLEYFKENKNSYEMEYEDQNNSLSLNKILYGPPGTGKTYTLQNEYFNRYTIKESSLTSDQFLEKEFSDLSWFQVITLIVLDLGKTEVTQILNHEFFARKAKTSLSNNLRQTAWGNLQAHTIEDCENVNHSRRVAPLIFYKDENGRWSIVEKELNDQFPEARDMMHKYQAFKPMPDKQIRNYEFVTFHQSFSYEDFVEGIKPVMEDGERDLGYEIQDGVFKKLCQRAKVDPENNYAIFIDEINRGNVSAIFGELITLIEKDKRAGGINELEVQLPYSKDKFSVPANLHIYGTMNTADRSVEALDTALRRRFTFKELMPNPSLLSDIQFDGFTLEEVLKTINERIEVLVDRDHTIGHSYFLSIDSGDTEALFTVFQNKIIPLLQEYFYHDYEKMALILGAGFIEQKKNNEVKFASFGNLDIPPIDTQLVLKDTIGNIEEAVLILLNKSRN